MNLFYLIVTQEGKIHKGPCKELTCICLYLFPIKLKYIHHFEQFLSEA